MKNYNRAFYQYAKRIFCLFIYIIIPSLLMHSIAWSQEKRAYTQDEIAKLIGEAMDYAEDHIGNLKKIGVTPLGEWDPAKPLTKDDFDAILIRIARKDPIVEKMEPAKLLDSMGFPPRDVSEEGIKRVLESNAFKMITINPKLLLSGRMLPLPLGYKVLGYAAVSGKIGVEMPAVTVAAPTATILTVIVSPPGDGVEPPPTHP